MSGLIGLLVSVGCVLVAVGLAVRFATGNATVLKLGGLLILLAFAPAVALGLFGQMMAATPGGASGLGLILGLAVLSGIAFVAFKVWLGSSGPSARGRGESRKVERKRLLRFDDDEE